MTTTIGPLTFSPATLVVGVLMVGFVFYLAMNNRLTTYASIMGL